MVERVNDEQDDDWTREFLIDLLKNFRTSLDSLRIDDNYSQDYHTNDEQDETILSSPECDSTLNNSKVIEQDENELIMNLHAKQKSDESGEDTPISKLDRDCGVSGYNLKECDGICDDEGRDVNRVEDSRENKTNTE